MSFGLFALLAIATSVPQADIGEQRIFGDWAVGCDNVSSCEAISLDRPAEEGTAVASVTLRRAGGPDGAIRVGLRILEEQFPASASLVVDGEEVGTAAVGATGDVLEFESGTGQRLIYRLANGGRAELRTADGETLGSVSLDGSYAALLYMEDRQGRAGTVTAGVAVGDEPAANVPAAPPLPVIAAAPVPAGTAAAGLSEEEVAAIRTEHDCFEDAPRRNEAIRMSERVTLVLVSCGGGAYNFTDFAFVVEDGARRPAMFDAPVGWGEDIEPALLVNAWWNGEAGTLDTYAKGRGPGDCGTAQRFAWDGTTFRLVEQRVMNTCRGSPYWITVYRADVRRAVP